MMRRRVLISLTVVLALLGVASPAAADPATPTNYRSTVESVEPESGFTAEIIGGDVRDIYLLSPLGYKLIITTGSREGQVPISLKG